MTDNNLITQLTTCDDCVFGEACAYRCDNKCERFLFHRNAFHLNRLCEKLRLAVKSDKPSKMTFSSYIPNGFGFANDRIDSLDYYYVQMINDSLGEIRKHHTAYLFTLSQVYDVFRLEPDCYAEWINGVFALRRSET